MSNDADTFFVRYDLGSGNTKAANFIWLTRLDLIVAQSDTYGDSIDFALSSSSDDSSYTARHSITDISTATLKGVWSNDYVSTFTATSAFRYWRAGYTHDAPGVGGSYTSRIGKIYFGTAFDMGNDPDVSLERKKGSESPFVTSGGVIYQGRVEHPTYDIDLTWEGISDSISESFYENIARYRHTTTFGLLTTEVHEPLDGHEIIHVRFVDVSIEKIYQDWNRIRVRAIEVHG